MEYKDIASVSGKGGLFKIIAPSRAGVILESLDALKKKFVAGVHQKVSVLDEISIFTSTEDGSEPLKNIMITIHKEFDDDPGVDNSSSPDELIAFFKHILPEYDENRVYVSDIKKVITWYKVLYHQVPELLKEDETADNPEDPKKND